MSQQFEQLLQTRFGSKWKKNRGKRGMEYRACCPFCPTVRGKIDKEFKLYMNPTINKYNCYRCSSSGLLNNMFKEFSQNAMPVFSAPRQVTTNVPMPGDVIPLHHLEPEHVAIRYLRNRGFDTDILSKRLGVHYCREGRTFGDGESFFFDATNTIIFPVWMHQKIVGWQARLLYDPDSLNDEQCEMYNFPRNADGDWVRPPKYYTPWGMNKGEILYNFDNARLSRVVVVSEGPLDVAGIGMCGVGTFGKSIAEPQVRLIKEYWDLAILMLDPGDADLETRKLMYELQMSVRTLPVKLQGVKDPGDASFERIWSQIYDAAEAQGISLTSYDLGAYNQAIIRTTDKQYG